MHQRKNATFSRKEVHLPRKSERLAEFVGILIGDGGISKYQVQITLNTIDDSDYIIFVADLMKNLFGVEPRLYRIKNAKALNICVSRSKLVDFLIGLGLKKGNKVKQGLSIPQWIIDSPRYSIACLRGMIDTDGSIVREVHTIRGKMYTYRRLNFTSASKKLIGQAATLLRSLGFHPKLRRGDRSVQLENREEICDYLKCVGTHNPKHTRRFEN